MSIASRCGFGFRKWAQPKVIMALGIAFVVSFMGNLGIAADEPDEEKYVAQIFIGNADGSNMQRLADLPEYQSQGSPSWSQDGRLIAFDAYKPQNGERFNDAHLIVVNSDGGNARDLGRGLMPSLSPRGHRVVYSIHGQNGQGGVWIVDVDNPEKRSQIDGNGWGADWSPDGVHVAYARRNNLILYNTIEGTSEQIFDDNSSPVGRVYWNFSWSPDGQQLAFKAMNKEGKPIVAVVDAKSGGQGFKVVYEGETYECLDWTHDAKQIVVAMRDPNRADLVSLFALDIEEPSEPRPLPNLPMNRKMSDPSFSPDGEQLAVQAFKQVPVAKE
ncbi:MAG: DPP IV N-terminal domain-containing protein [Planctomycetaceae bacterium]